MMNARIIVLLVLVAGLRVFAQPPGDDTGPLRDWVKTKRVGFFTDKLNLTSKEAEKFWPVYNDYAKEIGDLRDLRRKNAREAINSLDKLDDKDIEKDISEELGFRQKELNVLIKYIDEFKKVLPIKKVARLLKAEDEFKIWILKEWKNHGLGPPGRGGDDMPPPGSAPPR